MSKNKEREIGYTEWFTDMDNATVVPEAQKIEKFGVKWRCEVINGGEKCGAKTTVDMIISKKKIKELAMKQDPNGIKRKIIFLGGAHGRAHGTNWIRYNNGTIAMDPILFDSTFLSKADKVCQKFIAPKHVFLNLKNMSYAKFKKIMVSEHDVIFGICFGGNDKAFLMILKSQGIKIEKSDVVSYDTTDYIFFKDIF